MLVSYTHSVHSMCLFHLDGDSPLKSILQQLVGFFYFVFLFFLSLFFQTHWKDAYRSLQCFTACTVVDNSSAVVGFSNNYLLVFIQSCNFAY